MTTGFEQVPIDDNAAATRKIGGQELAQGADTLFFQGVLAMGNVLETVHDASFADSEVATITLTGQENYVIVSMEDAANDSFFALAAVDLNGTSMTLPPQFWRLGDDLAGVSAPACQHLRTNSSGSDKGVYVIPTLGMSQLTITNNTGSGSAVTWSRVATPAPIAPPTGCVKRFLITYSVVGAGNYTAGETMTGAGQSVFVSQALAGRTLKVIGAVAIIESSTVAGTDFDVKFLFSDATAEGDPEPTDTAYAMLAPPIEFRASPTGNQNKTYSTGGSESVGFANGISYPITVSDTGELFQWIAVARAAISDTVAIAVEVIVEL